MNGFSLIKCCLTLALTTSVLCGCSSLPNELRTAGRTMVVTQYADWQSQLSLTDSLGYWVRLGGVVASVKNMKGITRLEMVNIPIRTNGKPILTEKPNGRFVADIKGFVEPFSLQGQLITLLGTSKGTEKGKVGEHDYTFPAMTVKQYHVWHIREQIINAFPRSHLRCRPGHLCHDYDRLNRGQIIQVVE